MNLFAWWSRRQEQKLDQRIYARVKSADVADVGLLAQGLWREDKALQALAESALIRLLPRLKSPQQAALLTAAQREDLYRALQGRNWRLEVAILNALGKIGDTAAIPYVESLADLTPANEKEREKQAAARKCLTLLQKCVQAEQERARIEQIYEERRRTQLLRPASAPQPSGAMELRASQAPSVPADALRHAGPTQDPLPDTDGKRSNLPRRTTVRRRARRRDKS